MPAVHRAFLRHSVVRVGNPHVSLMQQLHLHMPNGEK